jgi:cobalamin biosynthesis protein CobT
MKGAVPLPLLRVLLDEMLDKSKGIGVNDESTSKEEGASCRYSGSVFVEEGRDSNNSFFYVNPTPAGLSEDIDDAVEEDDEFEGVDTFEGDDEFEGIDNFNDDELEGTNDFCLMKKNTAEAADAENDEKDTEATTLQEDKGKCTVVGFTSAWSQL